ncbi:amidohydrolase family protein [Pedobacter sp. SYP-B3415]|uniref:N-acyl-D-amino-acid deacylase family protein n=1 Tax=Pedobacter sp. SYP-B3415 TaxID=2496641 RepID=UPI00101BFC2D|nr:D-aminoacylase [Pedobacter sp. SYP-B3415]
MRKTALSILFAACFIGAAAQQRFDVLIKNGRIIDGSGNPWFKGDVGIKAGKIAAVGNLQNATAAKTLDAGGLVVAPGFIDVHTHIEDDERKQPTADNFIYDGVTTVVTGNCGSSENDLPRYFSFIDSLRLSVNVASFIGHNNVRRAAMGMAMREPSAAELDKMRSHIAGAMKAGAVGFSTGLIYTPGTYSKSQEVIELAKVAASYGGLYTSHMRSEADKIFEAIDETINIGRQAKMRVEISHFKVGKPNWGRTAEMIEKVEDARLEGIDVTVDQYPYTASSTGLSSIIPSWALADGTDSLKARLKNPQIYKKLEAEMVGDLKRRQRKNFDYAMVANYRADTSLNGKSIMEINRLRGRKSRPADEIRTILEMMENGGAQMVFHGMDEQDVEKIMQYPYTMIASDASIRVWNEGVPHPRGYGSNARVLGRYVREKKIIRLEDAIRKMTSLPAQKMEFKDRGLLKAGMAADVVVFDPATVADKSVYNKPHQYSTGFRYVLVNGALTLDNEKHTGARAGTILRGPSYEK